MVSEISRQVQPQHVNRAFTGVGPVARAPLGQNEYGGERSSSRRPARRDW